MALIHALHVGYRTPALSTYPEVQPTELQLAVVRQAELDASRYGGLQLPDITWHFVNAPFAHRGESGSANGRAVVYLSASLEGDALRDVSLHELRHVHDVRSDVAWSLIELERLAIAFVAQSRDWRR